MAGLLGNGTVPGQSLRRLLDSREMVLAPGCYDALGAGLVEEAGFGAAYMTGFGTAASRLGRPYVGLMTLSEMADNARRISQAIEIPVIADADTGYGNPINGQIEQDDRGPLRRAGRAGHDAPVLAREPAVANGLGQSGRNGLANHTISGMPSANIQGRMPKPLAALIHFLSGLMLAHCC